MLTRSQTRGVYQSSL
uniref:Uncharacterized protein n=1 Tax=Arundo donax TaxID=35708 RepID=A0A0A8XSR8_ARUDO